MRRIQHFNNNFLSKLEDDRVLKFTHAPPNPFDDTAVTTQKKQTSPIKYFDMVPVTRSRAHSLKSQIEVNKNMSPRPCDLPPPETLSAPEESCSDRQTSERKCRSKPLQQSVKESANRHHRRSRKSRRLQIAAPDTTVENASPNLLIKLQGAYLLPNNPPSSVPSYKFRKRSALENTCNLDPELERELMVSPQRLNGFCRSSDGDSFHGSDGM
jgi:hypothetical protein